MTCRSFNLQPPNVCRFALVVVAAFALGTFATGCAHHRGAHAIAAHGADVSSYDGGAIYRQQCATCHGVRGEGVAGVAPGLRLDANLDSSSSLVAVARGSRHGDAVMPGWCGLLSDREIADVMAYVRITWGGRRGVPSPAEVATLCRSHMHRGAQ